MKIFNLGSGLVFLIAGAAISAHAQQAIRPFKNTKNTMDGFGGIAFVCREKGEITSARLMDLWEPEGLKFSPGVGSVDEQVDHALVKLARFDGYAAKLVREALGKLPTDALRVKKPIPLSADALPQYAGEPGKECELKQVTSSGWINELQKSGVRIWGEVYDSPLFSDQDRAGMKLHDAVFLVDQRDHGAANSLRARIIVAALLSDDEITAPIGGAILRWASAQERFALVDYAREVDVEISFDAGYYSVPCDYRILLNDEEVRGGSVDRRPGMARLLTDRGNFQVTSRLRISEIQNGLLRVEVSCAKKRATLIDIQLSQNGKNISQDPLDAQGYFQRDQPRQARIRLIDGGLVKSMPVLNLSYSQVTELMLRQIQEQRSGSASPNSGSERRN